MTKLEIILAVLIVGALAAFSAFALARVSNQPEIAVECAREPTSGQWTVDYPRDCDE